MLDNFENNRVTDRPTIFDKVIPKDYAVPDPGPSIERSHNFSDLDYFQLFVSNEIIEKIAVYTVSNVRHKGQANFNLPRVDEIKAFFGLYIAANDFIVTLSDHRLLSKMKQNGCFILLDFAQFLPLNVLKTLSASFTSLTHTT